MEARTDNSCLCGCGRSMTGYHWKRNYHDQCSAAQIAHEQRRLQAQMDRREVKRQLVLKKKKQQAESNATCSRLEVKRVKLCRACMNLPHRRSKSGCPTCGLPYADN